MPIDLWAVDTTGSDFVLDIVTGGRNNAGLEVQPHTRYTSYPDAHINAIRQAVSSRADVIITVSWYQAVVDESATRSGGKFAVVNYLTDPAALAKLNIPFVGQDPYTTGHIVS